MGGVNGLAEVFHPGNALLRSILPAGPARENLGSGVEPPREPLKLFAGTDNQTGSRSGVRGEPGSARKPVPPLPATREEVVAIKDSFETTFPDGAAYIKETYGLDVTPGAFSTMKSVANKKAGKAPARRGRKPGAAPVAVVASNGRAGGNPAGLARGIKQLIQQFGAEAVKDMASVFAD